MRKKGAYYAQLRVVERVNDRFPSLWLSARARREHSSKHHAGLIPAKCARFDWSTGTGSVVQRENGAGTREAPQKETASQRVPQPSLREVDRGMEGRGQERRVESAICLHKGELQPYMFIMSCLSLPYFVCHVCDVTGSEFLKEVPSSSH